MGSGEQSYLRRTVGMQCVRQKARRWIALLLDHSLLTISLSPSRRWYCNIAYNIRLVGDRDVT